MCAYVLQIAVPGEKERKICVSAVSDIKVTREAAQIAQTSAIGTQITVREREHAWFVRAGRLVAKLTRKL